MVRIRERFLWFARWSGFLVVTPVMVAFGVWSLASGRVLDGVVALVAAPLAFAQAQTGWGWLGLRRGWPRGQPPRWRGPRDGAPQ